MATCHIYTIKGQETVKVLFDGAPNPPDVEGTVVSPGGLVLGIIRSRHGLGGGDIYDAYEKLVGSTDGMRSWGDHIAYADDTEKHSVGLVRNGNRIQRRSSGFEDDYDVGSVEADSWTSSDMEGLRLAAEIMGREVTPKLVELMQLKQRSLAGVAALLLDCV
jgi:hypothetical protein